MKTKNQSLKKETLKFLMFFIFACSGIVAKAQATGTCTVVQQPCNNNGILSVTITSGMAPPLDYYYYANGGYIIHSNISSLTDVLSGIGAPVTSVYVTPSLAPGSIYYSNGLTGMVAPFIIDPPITTNAICPALTGTAQLTINGGATPASVQWYNSIMYGGLGSYVGSGNPFSLAPGQYGAIVIDGSGCSVTAGLDTTSFITIYNVSGINFSVATTIASCTNGTANVSSLSGGMLPYTYLWSNGANTPNLTGLSLGTYTCTVTDAQGCYTSVSNYVPQSISIVANPVSTDATCLQNDGSIISFGSGGMPPYTYAYSNGMTTQSITGLSGGTNIDVTATDANGCISNPSYAFINTTTPIAVTYASTNSTCTSPTGSTTLTIAGGTAPYIVNWNTVPAMTGTTISGMAAGSYYFTVTDAVGCSQTGFAVIQPSSVITASAYAANPACPATIGSVGVTVSGTNPPFTYLWNTGATTASLPSTALGNYSCLITDNIGCAQYKYISLGQTSPITVGISNTSASCLYINDGASFANPIGGTPPYTYNWSNGQTTPTATSLLTGDYWVYITDANGCSNSGTYTYVGYNPANTSCYCTITGKVFTDLNANCIFDSGEQGIPNIMMHCSGFGYAFTDINGDYSFQVPTGTYTLSESVQYAYPLASCQSNAVVVSVTAASGCISTADFANNINIVRDMHIVRTAINAAVPGNSYTQGLIVYNDGTVNESTIQLGHKTDGQITYVGSSPISYTQLSPVTEPNWYSVTSGFSAMAPGTSTMIYFNNLVPTNIPISTNVTYGDTISYDAPMSDWLNDFTPWNNINYYQTTVVGSYDPNFKEVSPIGTGPQGFITTADSALDYVIHFQNTGTYYANKVVVVDTLDSDLDIASLHVGYSDHAYTATVSETGVLTFTFDNIHLDWQANSELGSRGLVSYSIKQKPSLAIGTQIKNSAAIYFDYNPPVITNQTLNTIQAPMGVAENEVVSTMALYPNPTTGDLNIDLTNAGDLTEIHIFDLQGRIVHSEAAKRNTNSQKVSVTDLVNGIYFIEFVNVDGRTTTGKFIKN